MEPLSGRGPAPRIAHEFWRVSLNPMFRVRALGLLAIAGSLIFSACGGESAISEASPSQQIPAAFAAPNATGEELANAWFGLLSLTGRQAGEVAESAAEVEASRALVQPYLDPAFTLIRATGERYTAGTYVPLDVDEYNVSDVIVTEPRKDIRVVRYFVTQPGATAPDSGVVMGDGKAPRISVLRWDEGLGHWVMVSHANFNNPIAAICDQDPITVTGELPMTSQQDIELGRSLIEQWRDITTGKSKEKVRHIANQIQLADGQGWPAIDGEPIEWAPAKAYDFANVGVARNNDLLVVSYDAVAIDLVMEGDEYRAKSSPRLLTYLLSPEGKWELIALANFTVPQVVPDDMKCVSASS